MACEQALVFFSTYGSEERKISCTLAAIPFILHLFYIGLEAVFAPLMQC